MKRITKFILGVVLTPLMIPFPETVAPEITVTVVDKSGNPVKGADVEQTWQHYTIEGSANHENKTASDLGEVTFDERTIWSNYLLRILGGLGSFLSAGIHASLGPSSWISASHECYMARERPNNVLVLDWRMQTKECMAVYRGRTTVINGETLEIDGRRIRLSGVDALEADQLCDDGTKVWACGKDNIRALSEHIGHRPVECLQRDVDIDPIEANCQVGGENLNAWIVSNGLAVGERSRGMRAWYFEEELAKTNKSGIWRGEFVMPWKWRGEKLDCPRTPNCTQSSNR